MSNESKVEKVAKALAENINTVADAVKLNWDGASSLEKAPYLKVAEKIVASIDEPAKEPAVEVPVVGEVKADEPVAEKKTLGQKIKDAVKRK